MDCGQVQGWESVCLAATGVFVSWFLGLLVPWFLWVLGLLIHWFLSLKSFLVSKFLGFEVAWFLGQTSETFRLLLGRAWVHITKFAFLVFWKILIPYPRRLTFFKTDRHDLSVPIFDSFQNVGFPKL